MAPLPPLTPTPPESTGARVPARTRSEFSDDALRQSSASLIFVKLRKMIASDTQPTETILGAIAVAAHSLTGATGAAVAMPRDGAVVCVGRSGDTAPELGARLNVDSGISGECLRTGVTMRCDDASRDFHVDAEVCRQLGLQSIAVVPLRGQHGRVGVLEAFSTESHAFNEASMAVLERLAGLAEAAWARGAVTQAPSVEKSVAGTETEPAVVVEAPAELLPPVLAEVPVAEVPLARVREALATAQPQETPAARKWIYGGLTVVAFLAVMFLLVYGWKAWYRSSIASTASRPSATASDGGAMVPAPGGSSDAGVGSSSPASSRSAGVPARSAAKTAGGPGMLDSVVRRRPSAKGATGGNATGSARSVPSGEEIPQIASSADTTDLGKALVAAPALPRLGVPISQGVGGGVLVHKVQPVYPAEARRMHVEGNVVIDAVVTEQGSVEDLKLVSGDPLLAPAALDAVRRWRYAPYSLNGKPIPKPTRITISFIAPQ
ncbi:MAG TPA: TonB family protein [Terriglobales bacterium]|nr:TonB family protein [Terriglobales bacterium]